MNNRIFFDLYYLEKLIKENKTDVVWKRIHQFHLICGFYITSPDKKFKDDTVINGYLKTEYFKGLARICKKYDNIPFFFEFVDIVCKQCIPFIGYDTYMERYKNGFEKMYPKEIKVYDWNLYMKEHLTILFDPKTKLSDFQNFILNPRCDDNYFVHVTKLMNLSWIDFNACLSLFIDCLENKLHNKSYRMPRNSYWDQSHYNNYHRHLEICRNVHYIFSRSHKYADTLSLHPYHIKYLFRDKSSFKYNFKYNTKQKGLPNEKYFVQVFKYNIQFMNQIKSHLGGLPHGKYLYSEKFEIEYDKYKQQRLRLLFISYKKGGLFSLLAPDIFKNIVKSLFYPIYLPKLKNVPKLKI